MFSLIENSTYAPLLHASSLQVLLFLPAFFFLHPAELWTKFIESSLFPLSFIPNSPSRFFCSSRDFKSASRWARFSAFASSFARFFAPIFSSVSIPAGSSSESSLAAGACCACGSAALTLFLLWFLTNSARGGACCCCCGLGLSKIHEIVFDVASFECSTHHPSHFCSWGIEELPAPLKVPQK